MIRATRLVVIRSNQLFSNQSALLRTVISSPSTKVLPRKFPTTTRSFAGTTSSTASQTSKEAITSTTTISTTKTIPNNETNLHGTYSRGFHHRYPVATASAVLLLGACGYSVKWFHDNVAGGTEGLWRSISFYSYAIPKYFVYRYHMIMDSPDHVWDALNEDTAKGGLQKILELEGFYIKCGQLCASNVGNAFPPIWQDTMSILQDQVPPQDFSVIQEIILSELPNAMEDIFESIDPVPIGSASIGQVHRAKLKKDGTPVVIKVCYPNVERLLRGDVRTIKTFCEVAQPVHVPGLEEIEKQFQTEFDYAIEGKHLEMVRENLTKAGLSGPGKLCIVPKPYLEYCTKRVLVMEELKGEKLAVELKHDVERLAASAGQTVKEFMEAQQAKERAYEEKGLTLSGPTAQEYDKIIAFLNAKRKIQNAWSRAYNWTVGLVAPSTKHVIHSQEELPLNHAKLVDDLVYVHGHEILVDGVFNSDPHPGNILLCRAEDGSPKLGLIDYGQVKKLSKEKRHLFCRLVIALANDDRESIVKLMKEAGYRSKRMDPDNIYKYAKVYYDEDNKEITGGLHPQMFVEELQKKDPIYALPEDFISIGRASMVLRGLSHALHQSRSMAKIWKPIAERVLREDI